MRRYANMLATGYVEQDAVLELSELLAEYEDCAAALEVIAESIPANDEAMTAAESREFALLARQTAILRQVEIAPIQSIADTATVMKFWHLERVADNPNRQLDRADRLVASVCSYLGVA